MEPESGGWRRELERGSRSESFVARALSPSFFLRVLTKPFRIITHGILKCGCRVAVAEAERGLKSPRNEKELKRDPSKRLTSCSVRPFFFPRFILFYSRVAVEIITARMGSVAVGPGEGPYDHKKEGERGGKGREREGGRHTDTP